MRVLSLLLLCLISFATANAGSLGKIAPAGFFGGSLTAEFKNGTRTDQVFFEQRFLGWNRVWVGGKPGQKGARKLSPADAAKCKLSMRRAIYDEVGVGKANDWKTHPPSEEKDARNYWLSRLYEQASISGRPPLTAEVANKILAEPSLAKAIEMLDQPDSVRDPAPDEPSLSLRIWADRIDDYRATEMGVYCDAAGVITRVMLSSYLIKNPPLTAAEVDEVRSRGTFGHAEEVFGPDSNYVALARNNGGAALWETTVDGKPVEITAVVDREGRLARLLITPAAKPE